MAPICREQSSVSALPFAAGENLYGNEDGALDGRFGAAASIS